MNKAFVPEVQKFAEISVVDGVSNFAPKTITENYLIDRLLFYNSDRPACLGAKQQLHLVILFEMSILMFYSFRLFWGNVYNDEMRTFRKVNSCIIHT